MKIGLIARAEVARGIAIQSKNFYDNMPVDRVLLVRMPQPDCVVDARWYENRTDVDYDPKHHQLDELTVRRWLKGLDVVFTVETPNDWRMPLWCREMGVKLIIQGNPEFVRHTSDPSIPHPDAWWWPTSWRTGVLPPGKVIPVPMNRQPNMFKADGPLNLVHVVGKRAHADRNGTELLVQAMRMVTAEVTLLVSGIDGSLPEFRRQRNVQLDLRPNGVEDRWEMYWGRDVLVLPRRYGGLCLPALEAAASGTVVMMPDVCPNGELAAELVSPLRSRPMRFAGGVIDVWDVNAGFLAARIDRLANDRSLLWDARARQSTMVRDWAEMRPIYLAEMEALL